MSGPVSGNRPDRDEIKKLHHHYCSRAAQSANSLIDILWSGNHSMHPHGSGPKRDGKKGKREARRGGRRRRWSRLQLFLCNGILTRGSRHQENGSERKYGETYMTAVSCQNTHSGWDFGECFGFTMRLQWKCLQLSWKTWADTDFLTINTKITVSASTETTAVSFIPHVLF